MRGPSQRASVITVIALGSNLGARAAHLRYAARRLRDHLTDLRLSRIWETAPVGVMPQPCFLNAVAVGYAMEDPLTLLQALLQIERERGRTRPFDGAARTLDLDLILMGNEIVDTAALTVPHPRFRERRFVLEPLAEIAPDVVDPVTGVSVRDLLEALPPSHPAACSGPRSFEPE